MSDEMLKKIMMKADDDLDMLKDRCHDLYDKNQELQDRIDKVVTLLENLLSILKGEK